MLLLLATSLALLIIMISGDSPFRWWIVDDWFKPLSDIRMADAVLHPWEVSYNNDVERGKRTSRNWEAMLPELRTAFIKLRHDDTVKEWANITSIPSLADDPTAHGAGLHCSTDGSFLQVHADYELHSTCTLERRLNLILFMHDRWEKEWGGELLLCDPTGKAIVEIEPVPGRLAVFECGAASYHGVRVIQGKQATRLSCAVYYLADARPGAVRRRAMFFPNRSRNGIPHEVQCSR